MPFADIQLRDNGAGSFDLSLSSAQTLDAPFFGGGPADLTKVQQKVFASTTNSTTHTVTLDSAPADGSTLILFAVANAIISTPSGWTKLGSSVDFFDLSAFIKTAGPSESSSVTITIGSSLAAGMVLMEYSGLTGGYEGFSFTTLQGGSGQISSGSTGVLTNADSLVLAVAGYRKEGVDVPTVTSWSDGFTEVAETITANSADADVGISVAEIIGTTTASKSSTATISINGIGHDGGAIASYPRSPAPSPNVFYQHEVTQSAGGQSLTASLYSDPDTFHSPSVSLNLAASLYVDPDTFHSPSFVQNLSSSLYVDPDTFPSHSVNQTTNLAASLYIDPDTFPAHTIAPQPVTLTASLYSDPDTFHSPTVTRGPITLTSSLFTNSNQFYQHEVLPGVVTLTAVLYTDPDNFHSATLTRGAVTLSSSLYSDPDTFHGPTVVAGAVTLSPSLYLDLDTFYDHVIEVDSGLPKVLVWTGSSFEEGVVYVSVPGLGFVPADIRVWNGTQWD